METVTEAGAVSLKVTEPDDTAHIPAGMVPVQVTVAIPLNPPEAVRLSWKLAVCPASIVT